MQWEEYSTNNCCDICDLRGDLVKDHCHRSMMVRGHLCRSCNSLAERAKSSRFQDYRDNPPYFQMGIQEEYDDWYAVPNLARQPCCVFCYHIPVERDVEGHRAAARVLAELLKSQEA